MFVQCVNCEFNVSPNDSFCLNCGSQNPSEQSLFSEKNDFPLVLFALLTLVCVILAVVIKISFEDSAVPKLTFSNLAPAVGIGLLVGIIFSAIVAPVINTYVTRKNRRNRRVETVGKTLCSEEDKIYERFSQFNEEMLQIESLLPDSEFDDAEENRTEKLSADEEKYLRQKIALLECETALCDMQNYEIDLIRRRNKILPFQQNLNFLEKSEINAGLEILDAEFEGEYESFDEEIVRTENEFYPVISGAFEIIDRQFDDFSRDCENLAAALKRRQAALGKGVEPMAETVAGNRLAPQISADFKIESILTDVQIYFDALSAEHEKLDETAANKQLKIYGEN